MNRGVWKKSCITPTDSHPYGRVLPPNNGARLPPSFNTLAGLTQEVRYSQAWRYIPVIPALRRMKYKEPVFGAYLGYLQDLSQKQTTKHHNNKNMKQTKQRPINLYL